MLVAPDGPGTIGRPCQSCFHPIAPDQNVIHEPSLGVSFIPSLCQVPNPRPTAHQLADFKNYLFQRSVLTSYSPGS